MNETNNLKQQVRDLHIFRQAFDPKFNYQNQNRHFFILQITYMSLFLALFTILSFTSAYFQVLIFPAVSFLKLEWVVFLIPVAYRIMKLYPTIIVLLLTLALRFAYDRSALPAYGTGILALLITYLVILFTYAACDSTWNWWYLRNYETKDFTIPPRLNWIMQGAFMIIIIILTTAVIALCNYLFIFHLYALAFKLTSIDTYIKDIVPFLIPFNLIQFGANFLLFWALFPSLTLVEKSFKRS